MAVLENRPIVVSPSLPPLSEVDDACRSLKLGIGAAELHGALCGWLAGGGADGADWLGKLLVDDDLPRGRRRQRARSPAPAPASPSSRIASFGFALLLPDEGGSLAERSGALFDWCRGFLGAFGLAAGKDPPLSEEGSEALADIAKLAAAVAAGTMATRRTRPRWPRSRSSCAWPRCCCMATARWGRGIASA